jgi:hypothetical protein
MDRVVLLTTKRGWSYTAQVSGDPIFSDFLPEHEPGTEYPSSIQLVGAVVDVLDEEWPHYLRLVEHVSSSYSDKTRRPCHLPSVPPPSGPALMLWH